MAYYGFDAMASMKVLSLLLRNTLPTGSPNSTTSGLNESPELIAQELDDWLPYACTSYRLNESPELIAQESVSTRLASH